MMRAGRRRPFTRLSDVAGGAAAIGDLKYLLPAEVTDDFLPPDGRFVYQDAYPGLKDVLKEYLEGDTLNWVQDAGISPVSSPQPVRDQSIAVGQDGLVYMIDGMSSTNVYRFSVSSSGQLVPAANTALPGGYPPTSCVACGKYVVFGTTTGNLDVFDTATQSWGNTVVVLGSVGNGLFLGVIENRYVVAFPVQLRREYMYVVDMQGPTFLYSITFPFAEASYAHEVRNVFNFLVVSSSSASNNNSSRIFTVGRTSADGAPVTIGLMSTIVESSTSARPVQIFVNAAAGKLFYVAGPGDTQLRMATITSSGQISASLPNPAGRLPMNITQACYDEVTDTLIVRNDNSGSAYFVRRARGKLAKMLNNTLEASDFENVDTPSRDVRRTHSLFTHNGRWFAISRADSGGHIVPIRAGPDANARKRHILPSIVVGNPTERLDGRTPYVRVK